MVINKSKANRTNQMPNYHFVRGSPDGRTPPEYSGGSSSDDMVPI